MNTIGTKTIETDRLILRRYVVDDAEDMFNNWTSDPEVTKFMPWPTHTDVSFTKEMLTEWVSYYDDGGTYNWGITLKGDDHVIGNIAVVSKDEKTSSFEIGYCLSRAHWGEGIMPEALKAVIRYLFDGEKDLERIFTTHDVRNEKSGRVMQKAGMHFDGVLRSSKKSKRGSYDASYYSILRSELVTQEQYEALFLELHPNFFERDYISSLPGVIVSSEQILRLQEFDPHSYSKELPPSVTFGFYEGPQDDLHEAIRHVNPNWVEFFKEDSRVYCGRENGKIICFCIIEDFGEHVVNGMKWKIGGPGCVGTLPECRGRGIGLTMVRNVTTILRDEFYDYSYIHFTGVAHWYARLGYKTILKWNKDGFVK